MKQETIEIGQKFQSGKKKKESSFKPCSLAGMAAWWAGTATSLDHRKEGGEAGAESRSTWTDGTELRGTGAPLKGQHVSTGSKRTGCRLKIIPHMSLVHQRLWETRLCELFADWM